MNSDDPPWLGPIVAATLLAPAVVLFACLFVPAYSPSADLLDDDPDAPAVTLWQLAANPADADGAGPAVAVTVVALLVLAVCVLALVVASLAASRYDGRRTARRVALVALIAGGLLPLSLVAVNLVAGANEVGTVTGVMYQPRPLILVVMAVGAWAALTAHWARTSLAG
jgi:hypothetical protein